MIRKFLPDIFCAAIILALAFFIAAGPPPLPATPSVRVGRLVPDQHREQKKAWTPDPPADMALLTKRNLFAESGSYEVKGNKPKVVIPENPYTLIAVLMGKEKMAALRDFTGAIQTFPAGKTLMDGSVITEISPLSVKLKKGKETKELKVFDVQLRTSDPAKKETEKTGQRRR